MKKAKLCTAAIVLIVFATAVAGSALRFWTCPGQGGPESVVPAKFNLGPGTGGPDKIVPARYWTGPGQGGPENVGLA